MCLCEQLAECHVVHVLVRRRDHEGEGEWWVVELAEGHEVGLETCEGSGDVAGVLPLIGGGEAQAFHDDLVVELRIKLGLEEEEKVREEQVEVEREKRVKEGAPWMVWRWLWQESYLDPNEVWDNIKCERVRSMCTLNVRCTPSNCRGQHCH